MLGNNNCIFAFIISIVLPNWINLNHVFLHFIRVRSDSYVNVNPDILHQHIY